MRLLLRLSWLQVLNKLGVAALQCICGIYGINVIMSPYILLLKHYQVMYFLRSWTDYSRRALRNTQSWFNFLGFIVNTPLLRYHHLVTCVVVQGINLIVAEDSQSILYPWSLYIGITTLSIGIATLDYIMDCISYFNG